MHGRSRIEEVDHPIAGLQIVESRTEKAVRLKGWAASTTALASIYGLAEASPCHDRRDGEASFPLSQ